MWPVEPLQHSSLERHPPSRHYCAGGTLDPLLPCQKLTIPLGRSIQPCRSYHHQCTLYPMGTTPPNRIGSAPIRRKVLFLLMSKPTHSRAIATNALLDLVLMTAISQRSNTLRRRHDHCCYRWRRYWLQHSFPSISSWPFPFGGLHHLAA